jgi:hypothetical protein
MLRSSWIVPTLVLLAAMALPACGRTPSASVTDGSTTADTYHPPVYDLWPAGEHRPPPRDARPVVDGRRVDGWRPPDYKLTLDYTPKPDVLPPPVDGPCAGSCAQICQTLLPCGLFSGLGQCVSACQTAWPATQQACLKSVVCSSKPSCSLAATCLPPTPKADLMFKSFTATASGSTITYTLTVCNVGSAAAGPFYVDLYYNRATAPLLHDHGEQFAQYPGLQAGACVTSLLSRANTPAGTYVSWAQADSDGTVAESDETNNVAPPVKVLVTGPPPPPGVDLAIQSMTATVTGSGSQTSVVYQLGVCNQGTMASLVTTYLYVYYNLASPPVGQPGDSYTTVPPLQPGTCTQRAVTRYNVPPGAYSSYAFVDPTNLVLESNESNNSYGPLPVSVGTTAGADLTIKSFTATKAGAAGTAIVYSLQVCNVGSGTAGPTQVAVYWNRAAAPKQGDLGDQVAILPTLGAGACTTPSLVRNATPPGTYASWSQVDPANLVAETDETNNLAGPTTITITPPALQPDLTISQFAAKATGPSGIDYSIVVCNSGQAPTANAFRVDVYYNRTTPPQTGNLGNQFSTVPPLVTGACTTIGFSVTALTPGIYASWAQVDATNTVAESTESNNVSGPRITTLGTVMDCPSVCLFAANSCGMFTLPQLPQCLGWCNGLNATAKACAVAATQKGSCADLKACSPLPPPPPPPPPGACADICTYLVTPCNILPQGMYSICLTTCQNLTATQLQCAQTAKASGQCQQILSCL